jgi:hypothetical protein
LESGLSQSLSSRVITDFVRLVQQMNENRTGMKKETCTCMTAEQAYQTHLNIIKKISYPAMM